MQQPGFYARIVFQDRGIPWRYAYVQQYRMYNPAAAVPASPSGDADFQDANQAGGVPGEASVYNVAGGQPYAQVTAQIANSSGTVTPTAQAISPGQVLNWADETAHCPNVPNDAIVWIHRGEIYCDPDTKTMREDATFTWSTPIYAAIDSLNSDGTVATWHEVYRAARTASVNLGWSAVDDGYDSSDGPLVELNGNNSAAGTVVRAYVGSPTGYNSDGTVYTQEFLFAVAASLWALTGQSGYPNDAYLVPTVSSGGSPQGAALIGRKTDDGTGAILQVDGSQSFTADIVVTSVETNPNINVGSGNTITSSSNVVVGNINVGSGNTITSSSNVVVGTQCVASYGGVAVGFNSKAEYGSLALGFEAWATAGGAAAIGPYTSASYLGSTVVGAGYDANFLSDAQDANGQGGWFAGGMNSLLYVVENWFSILTDCVGALGQGGLGQFYGRLIVDNTAYPYAADNGYDNLQVVGVQGDSGYGIYCPQYVVAGYAGARTLGATGTDGVNTFYGGIVTSIGAAAAIWSYVSGSSGPIQYNGGNVQIGGHNLLISGAIDISNAGAGGPSTCFISVDGSSNLVIDQVGQLLLSNIHRGTSAPGGAPSGTVWCDTTGGLNILKIV